MDLEDKSNELETNHSSSSRDNKKPSLKNELLCWFYALATVTLPIVGYAGACREEAYDKGEYYVITSLIGSLVCYSLYKRYDEN